MKRIIQLSLMVLMCSFATMQVNAQKIGHVDAQSIVIELPAFKSARSNLQAMTTQFQKQLEAQQTAIQNKLVEADKKYQRGELSPAEQKKIEAELQGEQQKLIQNEQKYQNDLLKKEEELTAPLYEKIRTAIKTVATASGYTHIFETASLLYAEESSDLTPQVKAKLGM